ncbi:hypothetical protein SAMN05443633_103366 [Chryseobacterium arachidis]|uniref:Uncharacterized protein n=1 Tax=Chryseobacterium arachidis TaxID=1416778 RepID=A0A1M5A4R9_9FLAO|nr:hypothetical protein [Chryseobacterium arachidis]SHF25268.1 hypothetical protein SAMN05443633_103366 [Chryseobacterium arachidis]
MKKITIIIFAVFSGSIFSQVAIGKTSVSSASVSLEFGTANRGMILPWVTSAANVTGVVNGTMIYDLADKKVKVKYAASWKDLSINAATGTTVDPVTSIDGVLIQNSENENTTAKVAIGALTSTPGILVLEDANKAMVLPKVASPHLNIINPSPGMMVYDTTDKQLAVFNGTAWTFWKQ